MAAFAYSDSPDPIRADLADAYRRTWSHIAAPGTWLTGAQRVAVAAETRRARACPLCAERKAALSPFAVDGKHDHAGVLAEPLVDAVHRVTTDAARLTRAWYDGLLDQGVTPDEYVEALGVTVLVVSIDAFHHAMGLAAEPLPEPQAGDPTRRTPRGVTEGEAWVPMVDPKQTDAETRRVIAPGPGGQSAYVLRALSLVPEQVRAMLDLSGAQYLTTKRMFGFETGRSLDRSQIELVAGRVSALNECFY